MTANGMTLALEGRSVRRHPLAAIGTTTRWYRRLAPTLASEVQVDGTMKTLWGDMRFYAGDYIVTDDPATHAWVVAKAIFEATYFPIDTPGDVEVTVFAVVIDDHGEEGFTVGTWADAETAKGVADRLQLISLERARRDVPSMYEDVADGSVKAGIVEVRIRATAPDDDALGALMDDRGFWRVAGGLDDLEAFDGPACRQCGCTVFPRGGDGPMIICSSCGASLTEGLFDACFRRPSGKELTAARVPAAMCVPCGELYVSPALLEMLGIEGLRATFAIESDDTIRDIAALELEANPRINGVSIRGWLYAHESHLGARVSGCVVCAPLIRAAV